VVIEFPGPWTVPAQIEIYAYGSPHFIANETPGILFVFFVSFVVNIFSVAAYPGIT